MQLMQNAKQFGIIFAFSVCFYIELIHRAIAMLVQRLSKALFLSSLVDFL